LRTPSEQSILTRATNARPMQDFNRVGRARNERSCPHKTVGIGNIIERSLAFQCPLRSAAFSPSYPVDKV
jgi:hypothetical protein